MVILIDPSDEELFKSVKIIADSGWTDEGEEDNLINLLESKNRTIEIIEDMDNQDNICIKFPRKKKFGLF